MCWLWLFSTAFVRCSQVICQVLAGVKSLSRVDLCDVFIHDGSAYDICTVVKCKRTNWSLISLPGESHLAIYLDLLYSLSILHTLIWADFYAYRLVGVQFIFLHMKSVRQRDSVHLSSPIGLHGKNSKRNTSSVNNLNKKHGDEWKQIAL